MKKFLHSSSAATAVEFAIIAPVFFLLVLGIVEIGLTMFMQSSLDTGIRIYARNGLTQTQTYDQLNQTMITATGGLYNPKKASINIYSTPNISGIAAVKDSFFANPNQPFDAMGGPIFDNRHPPPLLVYTAPQQILFYGIRYDWGGISGLMAPFIPKELYSFTVVRNENY